MARGVVARVAAGEVDRWVRRDLLGPQDLLVDVPHLLMRMPFLLGRDANEPERWNDAVMGTEEPYGLSDDIYRNHLQGARFLHESLDEVAMLLVEEVEIESCIEPDVLWRRLAMARGLFLRGPLSIQVARRWDRSRSDGVRGRIRRIVDLDVTCGI